MSFVEDHTVLVRNKLKQMEKFRQCVECFSERTVVFEIHATMQFTVI